MSFSLKPQVPAGNGDFDIDFDAIAEQIEDGPNPARVSLIVDLGVQKAEEAVSYGKKDDFTVFDTEDEANDAIDQMIEIVGDKIAEDKELDIIEEVDSGFQVPFKFFTPKDAQEVAIFVDLPDTVVDYGAIGEKQYRLMLNSSFMGDVKGFPLKAKPPTAPSKLWTFAPNSKLSKLAEATRHKEIISDGEHNMDIGRVLGEPLLVNIKKKGSFVNAKEMMPLMKGMKVDKLEGDPVGITFDSATVELLEAAQLRGSVIKKIKAAINYEGSNMQKAIEALEAKKASNSSESDSDGDREEPAQEAKPTRKRRQKPAEKPQEQEDDFDSEVPF